MNKPNRFIPALCFAISLFVCCPAFGDVAIIESVPEVLRENQIVIEGTVADVHSIPVKLVASGADAIGQPIIHFEDASEDYLKIQSSKTELDKLYWRHRALLTDVKLVAGSRVNALNPPRLIAIEYRTYPASRADVYAGPLPAIGVRYTFFTAQREISKLQSAKGQMLEDGAEEVYSVGLISDVGPPGILETLVLGADGELSVSSKTVTDFALFRSYLQRTGIVWRSPDTLPAVQMANGSLSFHEGISPPSAKPSITDRSTNSSYSWRLIAVLIVATAILLWLPFKRRS